MPGDSLLCCPESQLQEAATHEMCIAGVDCTGALLTGSMLKQGLLENYIFQVLCSKYLRKHNHNRKKNSV